MVRRLGLVLGLGLMEQLTMRLGVGVRLAVT